MSRPGPVDGPRPSGPPAASSYDLLLAGHVVVLVALFPLAVVLVFHGIVDVDVDGGVVRSPPVAGIMLLAAGFVFCVTGQRIAIRRLVDQRTGLRTGPLPPRALLHATTLIAGSTALGLMPVLLGLPHLLAARPPAPLLAALGAVTLTALLLDHAHAERIHRQLPSHRAPDQPLEARLAARVRAGRRGATAVHLLLALVAVGLLVRTATAELGRPDPAPLATTVQLLAALAGVVLVLATVAPVERVRTAVTTAPDSGSVHLPHLDVAAQGLGRVRRLAIPVAALGVVAVLADPAEPLIAAARLLVLAVLLCSTTLQHAALTRLALGGPALFRRPGRERAS